MGGETIRPAYSLWPMVNRRLRDAVATLTDEQLAIRPSPESWPLWATVGHTACQRVSWLCGFAGEPGAASTPFPNALYHCPGDEDLDHPLDADALAGALDATFRIDEGVLDRWTVDTLGDEIRRTFDAQELVYTRGAVIQRVFSHDIYHCAELNETLGIAGLPQIDLWD